METESNKTKENIETFAWLWLEVIILLLGVVIGVLSFIYNDFIGCSTGLFARSGSLLVLLGAVNEYRLRQLRDRQLSYIEPEILRNADKFTKNMFRPKVFFSQGAITVATHALVIIGTVIWGFGDLLFCTKP